MRDALGDREIAVCRELTKLHEEVIRTTLSDAAEYYETNEPRGEFVLVVSGKEETADRQLTADEAVALAKRLMEGGESASSAAKEAAAVSGLKKGEIYKLLMEREI